MIDALRSRLARTFDALGCEEGPYEPIRHRFERRARENLGRVIANLDRAGGR